MKLAVMQPYLFPYIGYFQLINAADRFVIYDDVNFIKKGWINRNYILINSKAHLFTVPLINSSQNKLIKDTEILKSSAWKKDLLKTIELNYKKAICFEETFEIVSRILNNTETNLSEFIRYSLTELFNYLSIETETVASSSVYLNSELKQQERIIDICKRENASEYINPIGGKDLYSEDLFRMNEIKLNFLRSEDITYVQFNDKFVKSLSVIDVMMFNSKEKISELLNKFKLI